MRDYGWSSDGASAHAGPAGKCSNCAASYSDGSMILLPTEVTMHTYIHTLDNAHNSQAQGLNLRRGRSLGSKRTVDINDERTDGFLDEI